MAETMNLRVNTGAVNVNIVDDDGTEIGTFRFNPNDINIIKRYQEGINEIEKIDKDDDKEVTADNIGDVSSKIIDIVNKVLDTDMTDIFSKCDPLTLTDSGDFFFEEILNGVANLIESTTKKRIAKKNARIQNALKPYKK